MPITKEDKINIIKSMMINHDTLNPKVFDSSNTILPETKEKLLKIADFLIKKSVVYFTHAKVRDIVLIGSVCSYIYNEASDLDLFIFVDDIVPHNNDLSNKLLHKINLSLLQTYKPYFQNHPLDFGILHVSNERVGGRNNYSLLRNEWNKEPYKKQFTFTSEEIFFEYCKYSADLHKFVASLDKINNAFLTIESCQLLTKYLQNLRDKAFAAKDNSPEGEYSLDYFLYRILKRFGTYSHFQLYILDSYKHLINKNT